MVSSTFPFSSGILCFTKYFKLSRMICFVTVLCCSTSKSSMGHHDFFLTKGAKSRKLATISLAFWLSPNSCVAASNCQLALYRDTKQSECLSPPASTSSNSTVSASIIILFFSRIGILLNVSKNSLLSLHRSLQFWTTEYWTIKLFSWTTCGGIVSMYSIGHITFWLFLCSMSHPRCPQILQYCFRHLASPMEEWSMLCFTLPDYYILGWF